MSRDWVQWHSAYDDPESSLSRRLSIVQRLIRDAVDTAPSGPIRLLSLCAGDARDMADAMNGHPRAQDISGALIELDPRLVLDAQANVAAAGVALDVRCGEPEGPTVLNIDGLSRNPCTRRDPRGHRHTPPTKTRAPNPSSTTISGGSN